MEMVRSHRIQSPRCVDALGHAPDENSPGSDETILSNASQTVCMIRRFGMIGKTMGMFFPVDVDSRYTCLISLIIEHVP